MTVKKLSEVDILSELKNTNSILVNEEGDIKQIPLNDSGILTVKNLVVGDGLDVDENGKIELAPIEPILNPTIIEDTPAEWVKFGTEVFCCNSNSSVISKPSTYGIMKQYVHAADVTQLWFKNGNDPNPLFYRTGGSNGWGGSSNFSPENSWRKILDETNGAQIVKLWENSSVGSSFAAQTITLSGTANNYIVVFNHHNTETKNISFVCSNNGGGTALLTSSAGGANINFYTRSFDISGSKVTFESTYVKKFTATSSGSASNEYLIPKVVYGIKGII